MSDSCTGVRERYNTTHDGFPDFRTVENPDPEDFNFGDSGRYVTVKIGGDDWSVSRLDHISRVQVHRNGVQIKNIHPVPLNRSSEQAQQDSFRKFLTKLGYPEHRSLHTDSDQ